MPELGEIRDGKEINKAKGKHIWIGCEHCGKERWVVFRVSSGEPIRKLCHSCATAHPLTGALANNWKGGRIKTERGYWFVRLQPNDFFHPMVNKARYVFEHRLVMARHLNRCLLPWELIHHKGTKYPASSIENRGDNRLENLELLPHRKYHIVDSIVKQHILLLEKRITLLEADNVLLRKQLEEVSNVTAYYERGR